MFSLVVISLTVWILVVIHTSFLSLQGNNVNTTDFKLRGVETCLTSAGIDNKNIIHRNSGNYTELNWQWNTLNGYVKPLAYLVVNHVSDVQSAVICCQLFQIRVVARSGGHSYVKNGYGDSNSLVIDLQRLNHISTNATMMSCEIGSGARVGLISYTLWKEGEYVIPVGVCPTVGIAGFVLGGGYGYFTRQFGLGSDNLIELEMVNAKGQLLLINNSTNKDLFRALRGGGGGSFGIVTKFKFRMHQAPKSVVYGVYHYSFDEFSLFYSAWQSFITSGLPNNIGTYVAMMKNKIVMEIYNFNFQNMENMTLSAVRIENLLDSFSFPSAINSSIKLMSYGEFLLTIGNYFTSTLLTHPSQLANITKHPVVGWKKVKSIYVEKVLNSNSISKLQELLKAFLKWSDLYIFHQGGALNDISPSETAFIHRKSLYDIELHAFNSDSEEMNLEANSAMNIFYEESRAVLDHRESYQNYLDQDIPDYLERYYGANLKRLILIKRKIDPENVFHHPQSIPVSYD